MEPRIDQTQFGSVTIDGEVFTHDVIIRLGGQVEKRKKKLSNAVYGTSQAVLRLVGSRHAKAATVVWRQIIKASSSNAIATRRVTGSSTASS